jgi:hypothetical protein
LEVVFGVRQVDGSRELVGNVSPGLLDSLESKPLGFQGLRFQRRLIPGSGRAALLKRSDVCDSASDSAKAV